MTATKMGRPRHARGRNSSSKGSSVYPMDRRVSKKVGQVFRSNRGRSWSTASDSATAQHGYAVKAHAVPGIQIRPVTKVKIMSQNLDVDVHMPKDPTIVHAETLLGPPLTKFILDESSKHDFGPLGIQHYHLADEDSPVANAVKIADMLSQVEDKSTIQAWFVGKNRFLGGRAPATVIVTDLAAVRRAARRFLAQG